MTRYIYETTIRVAVDMADEGENFEGEPVHWDSPEDQEAAAREWADSAMPLGETYEEEWVAVDVPPLSLIERVGQK